MHLFPQSVRCDAGELRRCYLRLALKHHPDKVAQRDSDFSVSFLREVTELFQQIQAAYEELSARIEGKSPGGFGSKAPRVRSAFAAACELGDLEAVQRMLLQRATLASEPDELGVTPLMFAAAGGSTAVCEALLVAKASLQTTNPLNWSALTWAALRGRAETTRWLLERGAPMADNDLIVVSFTGNDQTFKVLLDACDEKRMLQVRDKSQKGLLHFSLTGLAYLKRSTSCHLKSVDLAIQAKCDPWAEDKRSLEFKGEGVETVPVLAHLVHCMEESWANNGLDESHEHLSMIRRLCLLRADVHAEGPHGSALQLAVAQKFHRVEQALLHPERPEATVMQPVKATGLATMLKVMCWCCG